MDPIDALEERIAPLLQAAHDCLERNEYVEAGTLYKRILREIRDVLGVCHMRIADVFELLALVHAATGKDPKCRAIGNRVRVIRQTAGSRSSTTHTR